MYTTQNKNIQCQLLTVNDKTYMCAYLGMEDVFEDTKINFLINGTYTNILLTPDDLLETATYIEGESVDNSSDAQIIIDSYLTYHVSDFIDYYEFLNI